MSGNNPWGGGNRPSQQPPRRNNLDIEGIFSDTQDKIGKIFGGGGGGDGKTNKLNNKFLFTIAGLLLVAWWLSGGFYKVETSQQGVEMWFGRYHTTKTAGLRYHLPYPIQSVYIVDTEKDREIDIGAGTAASNTKRNSRSSGYQKVASYNNRFAENQMLTGDENIVNVDFLVRWKVAEANNYLFNIENPEQTVRAVSEAVMREIVGKSNIDDVLTDGRGRIESEVKNKIQETLDVYKAGVEISQVAIKKSSPPVSVESDFKDVQAARADEERFVEEATTYANKILPSARGQAQKLLQEAEAYKEQSVAEAIGETNRYSKIYAEYKKAPFVTKKRMELETIENVYGNKKKLLISGENGGNVIPFLPINNLLKGGK